jgi:D-alanyl-D-alanine carboxypeptidase/D-alanyl-D-alanine-endopeptidase (penicillin-binding protein 4)
LRPARRSALLPLAFVGLLGARPARAVDAGKPKPPVAAKPPAPDVEAAPPPAPRPLPGLAPRPTAMPPSLTTPDAGVAPAPKDAAARRAWLKAQLDETLASPALGHAKVGVVALESDTGKVVYARNADAPLNAASNVKLVTSAAALALLGPEYRWRTTLSVPQPAPGAPSSPPGEVTGDLVLRGGGDPTLAVEDLAAMVADVAALGIRKIHGALVVDDRFFDPATVAPAFEQKSESSASRAASSAASLAYNVVTVTIIPGAAAGAPARVTLEPASPYFVLSGAVTTAGSGPASPAVETKDDGGARTRVTVAGRILVGAEPRTFYRRVVHPALFLGASLRQQLERRGIIVDKPTRVAAAPATGQRVLSTHESAPLAVVVQDLNKRSNNFMAEQVVRTMGAELVGKPGTWDKGLAAVAKFLASAGLAAGSYQMSNGSGLYDSNRFSAAQIAAVLRAASRDFRVSAEFLSSLAVAGTDGTIAHRMAGSLAERYVRGKTGTLAGVSCLSGFAGSPGRVPLIFSVLMNDVGNAAEARRVQDRVAELLVAYLEAEPSSQP